jgi:hypothetical protein
LVAVRVSVDESLAVGCNHVLLDAIIRFQKPYLELFIQFGDTLSHPRAHVREVEKEISQRISKMLNVAGSMPGIIIICAPSSGGGVGASWAGI